MTRTMRAIDNFAICEDDGSRRGCNFTSLRCELERSDGKDIDALIGQRVAAGCRSMCGGTLNPILASSPARASSLAKPEGVNGPPRSEAKTKGEADWRFSSRS